MSGTDEDRTTSSFLRGLTLMFLLLLCLRPHLILEESKPLPSVIAVWVEGSAPSGGAE